MKGDIVIDKNSGLVFRDGKVLGRKNYYVQVDTSITHMDDFTVKAATAEEAKHKALQIARNKYKTKGVEAYYDVVSVWSSD